MRVLIVGPGAVGGFLGARLMAAGDDVALLALPERADRLRREGLRIREGSATETYRPRVLAAPELEPEFDLVVFAVKSDAFGGAIDDVAPAFGPSTAGVPFLNGMRHVEPLVARFGSAALGGVLRIATEVEDGGVIRVLAPLFEVEIGALASESDHRVEDIASLFRAAGAKVCRHRRRHVDEVGRDRLDRSGHVADARLGGRDRRRPRWCGVLAVDPRRSCSHRSRCRAPRPRRSAHRRPEDPYHPRVVDDLLAIA
jgi:ketopantoate reductase